MKSYTDLEQSKKLVEILPIESADMYWKNGISDKYFQCFTPFVRDATNMDYDYDVPCWSLAAMLDVLPILERKGYQKSKPQLLYNVAINKWIVDSHVYTTDAYNNPIDACYELILKLHEQKLL